MAAGSVLFTAYGHIRALDAAPEAGFGSCAFYAAPSYTMATGTQRPSSSRQGVAMPGPHVPFLDPRTRSVSADWRRYFADIDRRLGGILGPSVASIQTDSAINLQQIEEATSAAAAAITAAATVAEAVSVVREVAITNGLSGADQIPTQVV